MLQIKFRGKRLNNGEWVYGDLLHPKTSCRIVNYTDSSDSCAGMTGADYHYYDVDESTIGQFTGLYDRDGKEIFEGDIVESPYIDPIFGDPIIDIFDKTLIEFHDGAFVINYNQGSHRIYLFDLVEYVKVISNIHDNPELLNEKDNHVKLD